MDVIIGIGNPMRGDDGIGPRLVEAVEARPDVRALAVHQLLPEHVDEIRAARRVLFVDARVGGERVQIDRVHPSTHRGVGHSCSPGALLGWARFAYQASPASWLLSVPGGTFTTGAGLSPGTAAMIPDALRWIDDWLDERPEAVGTRHEEEA